MLISTDQPVESLSRTWFFLPRMLAPEALVLFSQTNGPDAAWRPMSLSEIKSLGAEPRRRAA